jgi:ubiquinone/menaquinone biosynthesis C-methylase UbiE
MSEENSKEGLTGIMSKHYDTIYENFSSKVLEYVRRDTYGNDFGQNSWLTEDEFTRFLSWLELDPNSHVLDIACGSGGPALFIARKLGCHVTGLDISEKAVSFANIAARGQHLDSLVCFQPADATLRLPFADEFFDSVICIDSINHLHHRSEILAEWYRVLRRGGRILFTDGTILTGLVSNEEIAARTSIGYFLLAPPSENERLIRKAGFEFMLAEDVTENIATLSKRRLDARAKCKEQLVRVEGDSMFKNEQEFYSMMHKLSQERRLSRFVFVGRKSRRLF